MRLREFGLLAALAFLAPAAVPAKSIESVISPGRVIAGHADLEDNCQECHVRFDKSGQTGLCLDCHKDVAKDVQLRRGFHGRIKEAERECRLCHTDHKGRDMNIAPVDEKTFDHRQTDFVLKGGHVAPKVQCRDCHAPKKKWREAPLECIACHKKDDVHKGKLGAECADCHDESDWKKVRFDHGKTKFPLRGKHKDVECKDCHDDPAFKGAPMQCYACHKKDDDKKGHKGKFGQKCETCHTEKNWTEMRFDHDRDTKYPLRGKHRLAKCEACHTGFLYKEKLKTDCYACHKKDDDTKGHKGRYGGKCETCHVEKDWRVIVFDHNRDTKYPLRGKHVKVRCDDCHTGDLYKQKLRNDCFACHEKDDKHEGQEGKKCETCHNETSWTTTRFDHGLTRFPLLGKHVKVECKECHPKPTFKDAKTECVACHRKDDKHKKRLGVQCELCHNARDWKRWDFDHDKRTKFKLDGGHKGLDCHACHSRPVEKDLRLPTLCVSCHEDVDVHNGSFGRECERCHVSSSWKKVRTGVRAVPVN